MESSVGASEREGREGRGVKRAAPEDEDFAAMAAAVALSAILWRFLRFGEKDVRTGLTRVKFDKSYKFSHMYMIFTLYSTDFLFC